MPWAFFRAVPLLFYFIKEMYRRDTNEGMSPKKRVWYRTYLAISLSLLCLLGFFAYRQHQNYRSELVVLQDKNDRYKAVMEFSNVERERLQRAELKVEDLTHRMARLSANNALLVDVLKHVCTTQKIKCDPMVLRIIKKEEEPATLMDSKK